MHSHQHRIVVTLEQPLNKINHIIISFCLKWKNRKIFQYLRDLYGMPSELVVALAFLSNVSRLGHYVPPNIASYQHFHLMQPSELAYNHVYRGRLTSQFQIFPRNSQRQPIHCHEVMTGKQMRTTIIDWFFIGANDIFHSPIFNNIKNVINMYNQIWAQQMGIFIFDWCWFLLCMSVLMIFCYHITWCRQWWYGPDNTTSNAWARMNLTILRSDSAFWRHDRWISLFHWQSKKNVVLLMICIIQLHFSRLKHTLKLLDLLLFYSMK